MENTIKIAPTEDGHLACPKCGAPLVGTLTVFHYEVKPIARDGGGQFNNTAASPVEIEPHGSDEEFIELFCDADCGWEWKAYEADGAINPMRLEVVTDPAQATHYEEGLFGNYRIE